MLKLIAYSGITFKISLLTDIMRSLGFEQELDRIKEFL